MKRLTLALLTALIFLLAIGGTGASSDGSGVKRLGILEEIEKESLFNYFNGEDINPKRGVYEGQTGGGSKVSFVVGQRKEAFNNTGDAIYNFRLSGDAYKTSETGVWRHQYQPDQTGRRLYFYETFFSNCERGEYDDCIAGRWADNDVVVGSMPKVPRQSTGFIARWVRAAG